MSPRRCILSLILLAPVALGAEADPGLTGKAELGYLATSGNTDTSSLNAKLDLKFETGPWRHGLVAAAIKAEDSGATTAERHQLGLKSDRKFTEHDYVFAAVNWEQDEFAGYSQRTSEAIGYGHRKLWAEAHHLELEIGVGARQTDFVIGPSSEETILRLSGKYNWRISDGATFDQSLLYEKGNDNTFSESVTALAAKIVGTLSMKFSYTMKNNSDVQPGLENTDTYTSVGIEYTF